MEQKLMEKTFKNTKELKVSLKDIWRPITPDITETLSLSMPKRLQTIIVGMETDRKKSTFDSGIDSNFFDS